MHIVTPDSMGYDRVVTSFSPDGRLFQVQYAMEAVKRGATVVGLIAMNAVLLVADKRITTELMVPESVEKIYKIDEHIGVATSGLVADGRKMVDEARVEAQRNKLIYGEPIETKSILRYISDMAQMFTQYGGLRPVGVSLLVAGYNSEPKLFETDPSGTPTEWKATALGEGREEAMNIFEKDYKEGLSVDEAMALALKAIGKVMKRKPEARKIEAAIITKKGFKKLSEKELDGYLAKVKK